MNSKQFTNMNTTNIGRGLENSEALIKSSPLTEETVAIFHIGTVICIKISTLLLKVYTSDIYETKKCNSLRQVIFLQLLFED